MWRWYSGNPTYDTLLLLGLASAAVVFVISIYLPSPYGRFASERFGLRLDPRLGWFLMELPSWLSFAIFFAQGSRRFEPVPLLFAGIWAVHYANRGFYFPLKIRVAPGTRASFSLMVVAVGWAVTTLHGYLNATYFAELGRHYTAAWLTDPRFALGLGLYGVSLWQNIHADAVVRRLRPVKGSDAPPAPKYAIPRGGLFEYVSCPSYLTELLAWAGFALCAWSLAGVFILAISAANLVPRARATHAWYKAQFPDYPTQRKALVPFVF
jgi:3-oxo-5-alpha-steroid 4-dehydrogenase 1